MNLIMASEYTFTILLAGWLAYHRKEVSLGAITVSAKRVSIHHKPSPSRIKTMIFCKAQHFVSDWIVKGKAKLIRHKKLEPPALPPSPMDYDRAQQYLAAVAFFESNPIR